MHKSLIFYLGPTLKKKKYQGYRTLHLPNINLQWNNQIDHLISNVEKRLFLQRTHGQVDGNAS